MALSSCGPSGGFVVQIHSAERTDTAQHADLNRLASLRRRIADAPATRAGQTEAMQQYHAIVCVLLVWLWFPGMRGPLIALCGKPINHNRRARIASRWETQFGQAVIVHSLNLSLSLVLSPR